MIFWYRFESFRNQSMNIHWFSIYLCVDRCFSLFARQPISRVLSFKLVIYLGLNSHLTSSNQPRWLTKNCFWPKIGLAISIWSCSRWGFPCVFCYQKTGALLPHLFTLASIRRFIFCGTVPKVAFARSYLAPRSYKARTFLSCFSTKATNQLSGDIRNMKKTILNQEFFKIFLLNYQQ